MTDDYVYCMRTFARVAKQRGYTFTWFLLVDGGAARMRV
jgi:hypothetical protein